MEKKDEKQTSCDLMELKEKQISCDLVYDGVPPLSSKYLWFIAQNLEAKDGDQIFCTIHNPLSQYRCRIPELSGRQVQSCYHGWVILSSHPDKVMWSLWNPITCRLIRLPPLKAHKEGDSYDCCLSSPPDDPSSIFLLTVITKPIIFFCRLDKKRKKLKWTKMSYAKQFRQLKSLHVTDDSSSSSSCEEDGVSEEDGEEDGVPDNDVPKNDGILYSLTCCNGKVYALSSGRYCFVIQVDIVVNDKEVVIRLLPFVQVPNPSFLVTRMFRTKVAFMGAFPTQLFYILISIEDETMKSVNEMILLKLDMANMRWEEMKDLKGVMFASNSSISYRPEIASKFGGYIHFLGETDREIYSYSVKNRTIFLSSMPSLLQTRHVSAWTTFDCRLGDIHDQQQEETYNKKVGSDNVDLCSTMGESHLLNTPFDILQRIMGLCVGVDYMNFRATCKCCLSAAPSIQWREKTALRRLQTYSLVSPWLVMFDRHQGIITFTDPFLGDKYFITTPQVLIDGFQIGCSRYGWLLMVKDGGTMLFYNPFTSDIRMLPQAPDTLESLCFTKPPTSPLCIVAGFRMKVLPFTVYLYLIDDEKEWIDLPLDFGYHEPYLPTVHDKDMYALCHEGGLNVIRNVFAFDPLWKGVIAEPPRSHCENPVRRFLAKCDQHLIQVVMSMFGKSIEVFNLNESKNEWEQINGLGKHMVYICGTTCLCVEAKTPEMENKIYFPILHSNKIVFFSLETCRYHTFNGKTYVEESFEDFFETEYHTNPHAWIEPCWF